MQKYPIHLLKLIDVMRKLPGVGTKSAERFAFELINWPDERLKEMASVIQETKSAIKHCPLCGCLTGTDACPFCTDTARRSPSLCVVATARDVFSIEATHEFRGLYHVLGALLSPLEGISPDRLTLDLLKKRIETHKIEEVVIALDSTLEGDATSLFLKQELAPFCENVSRLAFGLPMGSSLDYVDGGTLARAFTARNKF